MNEEEFIHRCAGCGRRMTELEVPLACPRCGSHDRNRWPSDGSIPVQVPDGRTMIITKAELFARRIDGPGPAVYEVGPRGMLHAETTEDGQIVAGLQTKPTFGEDDSMEVVRGFLDELRRRTGARWGPPRVVEGDEADCECHEEGIDCDAAPCTIHEPILRLQVTRVPSDQSVWRSLTTADGADVRLAPEQAAEQIRAAIERKARKYPAAERSTLSLILDARYAPYLLFPAVQEAYRARYGAWGKEQGFQAIYTVGRDVGAGASARDPPERSPEVR